MWVFTNSDSRDDISLIVRRQTGAGERQNGQFVQCNAAKGRWICWFIRVSRVSKAGGRAVRVLAGDPRHAQVVILETTEVMGAGWLSIIIDPTGAALGLWKPKSA